MKKTDLYLKPGTYIRASTTQGEVQGTSLENFVVSVLNNPTCCPKPSFIKDGMLMTAAYLDTSLQTVTDQGPNSSPLKLSTLLVRVESALEIAERLRLEADSTVTTQTSSVIQATTTNANLVIAPNGTGAIVASIPDGTATGGNARGQYAVDLQMVRSTNTKVASGNQSTISGGNNNVASIDFSVVSGGAFNTASTSNFATVVGGYNNLSSGAQSICGGNSNTASGESSVSFGESNNASSRASTISGGRANINSSNYSTVSGGQSNTASTNTHATVVGGSGNTSSGGYSVSGGFQNTASNVGSISLGYTSVASGSFSTALGIGNYATASQSTALGVGGNSYLARAVSIGNSGSIGPFYGVIQQTIILPYSIATLNSAATTVLSIDGTGVTNLIIPNGNNRLWAVKVIATAFVSVAGGTLVLGDSYMGEFTMLFKRVGGTSSVVGVNAANLIYDTNMATAAFIFAAGASQDLQITFKAPTTASATTFRCVAKVELVEVAY